MSLSQSGRSRTALIGVSAIVLVFAVDCEAAVVGNVQGAVSIDTGDGLGFKPLTDPTEVKPGDRVLAKAGGSAVIEYPDGHYQLVQPGQVVTTLTDEAAQALQSGDLASGATAADGPAPGGIGVAGGLAAGGAVAGGAGLLYMASKARPQSP